MNQYVFDGAVLAAQPRRLVIQFLTGQETAKNLAYDFRVRMEPGDGMPDVFLSRVSQQAQLGLVRPLNDAIGSHPVQALEGIVEEVMELALAPGQNSLYRATLSNFILERQRFLLELGDLGQTLGGACQTGVAFGRNHSGMRTAYPGKRHRVGLLGALAHRVCAKKTEGVFLL